MRRIGITACRLCVQLCVLAAGMATLVSLRARMGDALRRSALERASLKVMGTPAWDAISILQVAAQLDNGLWLDSSLFTPPIEATSSACSRAMTEHVKPSQYEGLLSFFGRLRAQEKQPLQLLSQTLDIEGRKDQFGENSSYADLVDICDAVRDRGGFRSRDRKDLVVVNIGARDGKGTGGNTDPTYPLFAAGYMGMAVEGSDVFSAELQKNLFEPFGVKIEVGMVFPQNAREIVKRHFNAVDVLKIDIDSWDCDVAQELLSPQSGFRPKVILMEYNTKFPPPIMLKLEFSDSFDSSKRGHVYECSLSWLANVVMRPNNYTLAQVDWQNAVFVANGVAPLLGLGDGGIDLEEAYRVGYSERTGRQANFPWNRDVDHLLKEGGGADDSLRRLSNFFAQNIQLCRWHPEVPCAQGLATFGTSCDNLRTVAFAVVANPGGYTAPSHQVLAQVR